MAEAQRPRSNEIHRSRIGSTRATTALDLHGVRTSQPTFSLTGFHRPLIGGRYVLLEEIGRGGMGVVYLSWDVVLRNVVAIKTLREEHLGTRDEVERLKREAALQMQLAHDGIVRLFHFEPWERLVGPYLLMEYVPWRSGDRWVAEAGSDGLPPRSVVAIGVAICDALVYAHGAGVLHGDLKPSNVFIDPSGERIKLADFGIATVLAPTRGDAFVMRLLGTPTYMAPEQRTRGAKIGPWTDVYLLAATLWEFLTCAPPKGNHDEISNGPVVAALLRGLNTQSEARPQDAGTFKTLLLDAVHG